MLRTSDFAMSHRDTRLLLTRTTNASKNMDTRHPSQLLTLAATTLCAALSVAASAAAAESNADGESGPSLGQATQALTAPLVSPQAAGAPTAEIRVDAGRRIGTIRAIHGINGGPICYGGVVDLSQYHKAIGIPLTRIHDANWPARNEVDIHTIFPTFTDDADPPGNYRFASTDDFLKSILAVGSGVMYRLGESIEHTPRQYYVHKPSDFDHWAKICLGIIRHYNDGWAEGFHFNLRYFEIWNEPEIGRNQWDGTSEDYYRLYGVTAKAIKARYPTLMVGGPALAHLGQLKGDRLTPSPHLRGFLEHCRQQSLPLDFLSWHRYTTDPTVLVNGTIGLRRVLDSYGFKKTEIHLDEWNYLPNNDWRPIMDHDGARMQKSFEDAGGPQGAAFVACALIGLQDAPLDMAYFYTGDTGCWGLFNVFGVPKKTYHAFRAFKALVDHPARLAVDGWHAGGAGCRGQPVHGWA